MTMPKFEPVGLPDLPAAVSKELIERLRYESPGPNHIATEAADHIEELERKLEMAEAIIAGDGALITGLKSDIDALQADNARLRGALACGVKIIESYIINYGHSQMLAGLRNSHRELLSATPEQSLARIRNQAREELALICEKGGYDEFAIEVRATKELQ